MKKNRYYRAASWWLTWEDMIWPDDDIADKFKRRADNALNSGVDMAVVYGAHFRWDYMPLWMNLHDMLAFIAEELHQRGILLFDHHSSVLIHRYANLHEAWEMRLRNRHHLPFAPSRDIAAEWTYNGSKLNDWRMIDIATDQPIFLKRYTAEQFCMNNPDFQKAYQGYVKKLLDETGIDGLMSDDGIFYSGWTSCGCNWCRRKFQDNYGHKLPEINDTNFWGNYKSEAFKDWIEMRFASSREFLDGVRSVVGVDFPLMTCCSDSVGANLPAYGMTYQEFIKSCNHIMLEMCGNMPNLNGSWMEGLPSQLLHLGISAENNAPCIGLGYGFTEEAADFIWAFNKFLGAGSWISSLKGRLGLRDSQIKVLKDDMELPRRCFNYEKNNPDIFQAKTSADIAVFFSRWSRDCYGESSRDYVDDYKQTCFDLVDKNIVFDTITTIPQKLKYKILCLSSVICLSKEEYSALNDYLNSGGIIIASGPCGCCDKLGKKMDISWLEQFDISCEFIEPECIASFPPVSKKNKVLSYCKGVYKKHSVNTSDWIVVDVGKGKLLWSPGRMQSDLNKIPLFNYIHEEIQPKVIFPEKSAWRFRLFEGKNKLIVHALAHNLNVTCMNSLEEQRKNYNGNNLINTILRKEALPSEMSLILKEEFKSVEFYVPLKGIQKTLKIKNKKVTFNLDKDIYYFILVFGNI